MSIPKKLTKFLKKHKVDYQVQVHPKAYTACETAQAEHLPGSRFIKPVIVRVIGRYVMVVVSSNRVVDLLKSSIPLGTYDVRIAEEYEFKNLFPDCEPGAMPPFGHLYGIPCYADDSLWEEDLLVFNAGNHAETISISTPDYFRVAKAMSGDFSVPREKAAA